MSNSVDNIYIYMQSPFERDRRRSRPPNSPIKTKSSSATSPSHTISTVKKTKQQNSRNQAFSRNKKKDIKMIIKFFERMIQEKDAKISKLQKRAYEVTNHKTQKEEMIDDLKKQLKKTDRLRHELIEEIKKSKKFEKKLDQYKKGHSCPAEEENEVLKEIIREEKTKAEGFRRQLKRMARENEQFQQKIVELKVLLDSHNWRNQKLQVSREVQLLISCPLVPIKKSVDDDDYPEIEFGDIMREEEQASFIQGDYQSQSQEEQVFKKSLPALIKKFSQLGMVEQKSEGEEYTEIYDDLQ